MLLQTLNSFMDRGFVGRLGPDALAAVGVGGQFMFVVFSLGMSISVGATALVARFTGAEKPEEARIAGNQALWIAGLLSLRQYGAGASDLPYVADPTSCI